MKGERLTLDIEQVAHGGICVARHEGRVVFVRHALPGERVVAEVTDDVDGRSFMRADAVEIVTASPDRVEPPCHHAHPGGCGGCDWQHASLPSQRELKRSVVREQLKRFAGLDVDVQVEPVPNTAGLDTGLDWRTRVQFAVDAQGRAGLRRHRSREIEPLEACPIAHPAVDEVGATRRTYEGIDAIEVIAAPTSGDRAIVVTARGHNRDPRVPPMDVSTAVLLSDGKRGIPTVVALQGRPGVREEAVGRTWRVSGSGFWQVHPGAADLLASAVLEALEPKPGEYAIDLYCGVGLFAGAIADVLGPGGRVTAVEADPAAAEDAAFNLRDVTGQVRVETGRVEHVLLTSGIRQADLVVLDPPRSGAGKDVTTWICSLRPRRIAYVACDPTALARDLVTAAANGYVLTKLRAFDLFPMTHHVECVATLEPQQ